MWFVRLSKGMYMDMCGLNIMGLVFGLYKGMYVCGLNIMGLVFGLYKGMYVCGLNIMGLG